MPGPVISPEGRSQLKWEGKIRWGNIQEAWRDAATLMCGQANPECG